MLVHIKKYQKYDKEVAKTKKEEAGSFDDSFAVEDDGVSMQQMTQILRQPVALLKKDIAFSYSELLTASRDGIETTVKGIVSKYGLTDISHVRGLEENVFVLKKKLNTFAWNPLLHAIHNDHFSIVKYYVSYFGHGPVEQMLYNPENWEDLDRVEDNDDQCFGMYLAISNKNDEIFDYLWAQKSIWINDHVEFILYQILRHWPEKTRSFLEHVTSQELFINVNLAAKAKWIRTRYAEAPSEIVEDIKEALMQAPYSVALVLESTRDLINIDKDKVKGNVRSQEVNYLIIGGDYKSYERAIIEIYGPKEDKILPFMRRIVKFNAEFYYQKMEDIFSFIRRSDPEVEEVPIIKRSKMFRNLNLIRNYYDPLIEDPTFKEFRWNIINYCCYYNKTKILDWLLRHCNCSIQEALKDSGDDENEEGEVERVKFDMDINGRRFKSYTIYLLMLKWRGKMALLHLAEYYPTIFAFEDVESIIHTLID